MSFTTISRTAYNLLVDDDGSGNTGSVVSKSTFDDVLDAVDAIYSANTGLNINGPLVANGAITHNGQIVFPSTQNPSSNANVLDDYAEGTWTPVWTSTGTAPTLGNGTITGKYTKIGRLVLAHVAFLAGSTTTFGNPASAWTISMPFTPLATNAYHGSGVAIDTGVALYPFFVVLAAGATSITMVKTAAPTGGSFCSSEPFTWGSGDTFAFSILYPAAN